MSSLEERVERLEEKLDRLIMAFVHAGEAYPNTEAKQAKPTNISSRPKIAEPEKEASP